MSPSRTTPGSRGTIAVRPTSRPLCDWTSVAAMVPFSRSSSTRDVFFLTESIRKRVERLLSHRLSGTVAPYPRLMRERLVDEGVQVPSDHLIAREESDHPTESKEWPE